MHEKLILTTKDFTWYFQYRLWFVDLVHEKLRFWQKKRLIARYFQYRLNRSVHEKLILTLTKNFAWYRYFQYRLWLADLMREKLFLTEQRTSLILSDLLILCRRNLFWQNKGIRLIALTYIYDLLMHEKLIYRTKGVPWYLPIYYDLLREKLMLTEQGLRMIPFNMLWFVVWETYVFNKVISTRDYLVLRSL